MSIDSSIEPASLVPPMDDHPITLSAREAAARLGIRRDTLYAYVSRGLIHSEPGPDGRSHRYRRVDIDRLAQRKTVRRRPEKAAEGALHFGSPVLESGLTHLDGGRITYRGLDACKLAAEHSVEEVAAWLWLGDFAAAESLFDSQPVLPGRLVAVLAQLDEPSWALETLQTVLPILGAADDAAWAPRTPIERAKVGARILRALVAVAAPEGPANGAIARRLATGWQGTERGSSDRPDAETLLTTCLILCADHELNVSAFTARCVASAGSPLHSVVLAGLAALQGPRHGGHTRRVEALLREAGSPDGVRAVFRDRLRRGEEIPGFGQPLYPQGDPRYLEVRAHLQRSPIARAWIEAIEAAADALLGERPTVDVTLAMVGRALGLPRDTPITLFALGRMIGWIAHAIEQAETGRLIRPRARYVGPIPETRPAESTQG